MRTRGPMKTSHHLSCDYLPLSYGEANPPSLLVLECYRHSLSEEMLDLVFFCFSMCSSIPIPGETHFKALRKLLFLGVDFTSWESLSSKITLTSARLHPQIII